jgi:hypothetical protein
LHKYRESSFGAFIFGLIFTFSPDCFVSLLITKNVGNAAKSAAIKPKCIPLSDTAPSQTDQIACKSYEKTTFSPAHITELHFIQSGSRAARPFD